MDIQQVLLGNMPMSDKLAQFGSILTTVIFAWAIYQQYLPWQIKHSINQFLSRYCKSLINLFSPYYDISFDEYTGDRFKRSEIYTHIEVYLSEKSTPTKARRLKAKSLKGGKSLVLGIADNEEVTDEYKGIKVRWTSHKRDPKSNTITFFPGTDEKRKYQLSFHRRHADIIIGSYLNHVIEQGQLIAVRKRQRKLFTNASDTSGWRRSQWTHVEFKHPASFRTIGMEPEKKQRIIDDLIRFSKAQDYYAHVGKPWKRGYLLYGPPGTGKSTMIAAIANLLEYDVYDLELTAVTDNVQLRRLLIETASKSIIVIEDIDCSLDLTGQRKEEKKDDEGKKDGEGEDEEAIKKKLKDKKKTSEVTLSGLLNFIDGIWSACGEERLIIFTTNYIDKLDPTLIRRGRMDMHIELSYCSFEAFKVLAKNYLDLDSHRLFDKIEVLLKETNMAPADVSENLMPKSDINDKDECLENLISELEKAKEDARLKEENEKNLKEEKEMKLKEEKEANKQDGPSITKAAVEEEDTKKSVAKGKNVVQQNGNDEGNN